MASSIGRDTVSFPSPQEQILRDVILIKGNSYSKNAILVLLMYCILFFQVIQYFKLLWKKRDKIAGKSVPSAWRILMMPATGGF